MIIITFFFVIKKFWCLGDCLYNTSHNKYTSMILYIEKQAQHYKQTQKIISIFQNSDIIWIDHYKNIFDKKI